MSIEIRNMINEDIPKISELFDNKKSTSELKWLFTNVEDTGKYNALVAIDDKEDLIGVIGYVVSEYKSENSVIEGIFPMSWKIKSN